LQGSISNSAERNCSRQLEQEVTEKTEKE
jgi:hypothetical protein